MIKTEIGEYIVGAYLKIIKKCNFVDYNVRPPVGGLEGLNELDVVGLDFKNKTAYLCEVTTHITGLLYKDNKTTIEKIKKKYKRQKEYADKYLPGFLKGHFMFWSPVVPKGYITKELEKIDGLELVINKKYAQCIDELRIKAKELTNDVGNPFFRIEPDRRRLSPGLLSEVFLNITCNFKTNRLYYLNVLIRGQRRKCLIKIEKK